MSWLSRWTGNSKAERPLLGSRLLVFDLETTGLDPRNDALLAIGAVAIENGAIQFDQMYSQCVQAKKSSAAEATLAHRLTREELSQAQPPDAALPRWLSFVNQAPCFAYHAAFDDGIMRRAVKRSGLKQGWPESIDLADWLLWLHPELGPAPPSLDRALAFARIHLQGRARHNALSDALFTAQLLLWLIPSTLQRGVNRLDELESRLSTAKKLRRMR